MALRVGMAVGERKARICAYDETKERLIDVRNDVFNTDSAPLGEALQYLIDEHEGEEWKTIQITDEQYELIEEEKEFVNGDMSTVELIAEALAQYGGFYRLSSIAPSEARETER